MPTVTAESVIQQFFEDYCSYDDSSFVTTEALHTAYTNFCAKNSYAVLAKEKFSKMFKQLFGERFPSVKRQTADGSRPRGYAGLSLRK